MTQPQPARESSAGTNTTGSNATDANAKVAALATKLEVIVIPVSDVDRAKEFYAKLGWRVDADFAGSEDFRVVQVTPPGSGCSIIFFWEKCYRGGGGFRARLVPDRFGY